MKIEGMDKEQRLVWEEYDPNKVREALHKSAGAFRDIDTVCLLQDIWAQREQKNRGRSAH